MKCPVCLFDFPEGRTACPACGWPVPVDETLPPGTLLQGGQFRLEGTLGQGGFGITYLATDLQLQRSVAIKELFHSDWKRQGLVVQPSRKLTAAEFQDVRDSFLAEARVLAQFADPGIVQVYAQFTEHNTAYLVMEYLQGESMAFRLGRTGTMPAADLLRVTRELAQALHHLHAANKLHRDIKPENVILERTGRAVLIDFGSAREFRAGQTTWMTQLITPGYAPLEQYLAQSKAGPPADLYALGATLHHALTGQMPPSAVERAAGTPLPPLPRGTPAGLAQAVDSALQMHVGDRPQTAYDFLNLLTAPQPSPRAPRPAPQAPAPRKWPNFGPKPLIGYLKYQRLTPNDFMNQLEDGRIQISELPPEVRAELLRMSWINAAGDLTFRHAWGTVPKAQPPKPTGSPSPPAPSRPKPQPAPPPPRTPAPAPRPVPPPQPAVPAPPPPGKTPVPAAPPVPFLDPDEIRHLWAAITQVSRPVDIPLAVPPLPRPPRKTSVRTYVTVAGLMLSLGGCAWGFGTLSLTSVGLSLLGLIVVALISSGNQGSPESRLIAQVEAVDHRIAQRVNRYQHHEGVRQRFDAQLSALEGIRDQLYAADQLLVRREQEARAKRKAADLEWELRRTRLEPGVVTGVGVKRVDALRQRGLSTAHAMDRGKLARVPGIGEKTIRDLMQWRAEVERRIEATLPTWSGDPLLHTAVSLELQQLRQQLADGPSRLQLVIREGQAAHTLAQHEVQQLVAERDGLLAQL